MVDKSIKEHLEVGALDSKHGALDLKTKKDEE
jgi:hypothetical protein